MGISLTSYKLGNARVFGFDKEIGLTGRQFGNINTLSSLCTIIFELPWVLAVRKWGANKAIGTAFFLWSASTLGTAFIHNYAQAVICRMILNAAEAGLAQAFAFLFSTIYAREQAGKRIMATNLAQCISGSFGGLFAYAVQTMGAQRGLSAWRWLFIIEFLITVVVGGIGWCFLPNEPEKAWFLNAEEKETMRMKKERDVIIRGPTQFNKKWIKIAVSDPFVWLLGIAFFTSSVAINGFGVFLPTILQGLGSVQPLTPSNTRQSNTKQICFIVRQLHDYSSVCPWCYISDHSSLLLRQAEEAWCLHRRVLRSCSRRLSDVCCNTKSSCGIRWNVCSCTW